MFDLDDTLTFKRISLYNCVCFVVYMAYVVRLFKSFQLVIILVVYGQEEEWLRMISRFR